MIAKGRKKLFLFIGAVVLIGLIGVLILARPQPTLGSQFEFLRGQVATSKKLERPFMIQLKGKGFEWVRYRSTLEVYELDMTLAKAQKLLLKEMEKKTKKPQLASQSGPSKHLHLTIPIDNGHSSILLDEVSKTKTKVMIVESRPPNAFEKAGDWIAGVMGMGANLPTLRFLSPRPKALRLVLQAAPKG